MTIQFGLTKEDFLTYYLFYASKSERLQKIRRWGRLLIPLLYAILGIMLFTTHSPIAATILIVLGLVWYSFYPIYQSRRYIKHYNANIDEQLKIRIGRETTLQFGEEHIFSTEGNMESKVPYSEIEKIDEIGTVTFIKLKSASAFILPKSKIQDMDKLTARLIEIAATNKIPFNKELNWTWK